MTKEIVTEKSATFSFFFFVLFGMVAVTDRIDHLRPSAPAGGGRTNNSVLDVPTSETKKKVAIIPSREGLLEKYAIRPEHRDAS